MPPWALGQVPVPRGSQIRGGVVWGLGVGGHLWEPFMQMTTPPRATLWVHHSSELPGNVPWCPAQTHLL